MILRDRRKLIRFIGAVTALAVLLPTAAFGTTLFGHPYVCYYNREVGSPNFDVGIIYMWYGTTYAGAARIPSLATGGFFAQGCWDALRQAMYAQKFTVVWTDAGPHAISNDMSEGNLEIFYVTIY